MKSVKNDRLKKSESELEDLEKWLKLGLVPKKDISKHKEEILAIKSKIAEEKERIKFLKESGEAEEYITPKRNQNRSATYTDLPSMPDMDTNENSRSGNSSTESGFDLDEEKQDDTETEHSTIKDNDETEETEEESYFSDKNRWKRGGIVDPEANDW